MTTTTVVNGYPDGFDITQLEATTLYRQIIDRNLFINDSGIYDYSTQVTQLFVTLAGGGGAGAKGNVSNGVFHSGGGGGSGGCHLKTPITIPDGTSSVSLACQIGDGGTIDNPDGGDTILTVICDGLPLISLIGKGGKGASSSIGGTAGSGNSLYSSAGKNGNSAVSSQPQAGGDGGDSVLFTGGKGYTVSLNDTNLCNGKYGSGGGGMIAGVDNIFGNGGKGSIVIEYS